MAQQVIASPDKQSTVVIDRGELVSYTKNGEELIHQKGDPGWRNADTEMFPIIGPTASNNFIVDTERGEAVQDQHGLLRELSYDVISETDQFIAYRKTYNKNTRVTNSKYPDKSIKEKLFWPYDFSFTKKMKVTDEALYIDFEIQGEPTMPFMLGYHPAFKLSGTNKESLIVNNKTIKLQEVLDVGSIAYPVLDNSEISLVKEVGYNIRIFTEGFNNFMLWTEVDNMLCIEPITAYPYTGEKALVKDLFKTCTKEDIFKVVIIPYK